ncbi:tryptophan--tRNA ligase [Photobacterium atrarenae]|uniref:Tryptophan--tRNA ligase n=1 Tax=Photobacterium atrarenae TaxID=865757 RepID=A0ABY5GMK9_9GAMM|nr:tryptophan--tRNA ligase [Photobacterium atrarenae]UTV30344.1 tryptophan--tRNA ligase [Photobacterium atrarenae]
MNHQQQASLKSQTAEKILTGDRATGQLHLGHFIGSLQQRVALQHRYQQTILVADMQGLTDNGHHPRRVADNILNVVADYLAVGIDPLKTRICLQSAIPALAELTMYYANLVTVARLQRNPTVKHEIEGKGFGASIPAGFLTYPISQAADITAFKATLVPVGDDQLPMLEQTNEIVRKLNQIVGEDILVECRPLLSEMPRLPAPDGKSKMSKSLGNCIYLDSDDRAIARAVKSMYTDPNHLRIEDPGCVEGNVVFTYLDAFHPDSAYVSELKQQYQAGGLGDGTTKQILTDCLQTLVAPIHERRAEYMADKAQLVALLKQGSEQAQEEADAVLGEIKRAFGLKLF